MKTHILVINPGSTSTKVAVYQEKKQLFVVNIEHSTEDLEKNTGTNAQLQFRKKMIIDTLDNNGFDISQLAIVIGRGGLIRPLLSGVYGVNESMKSDLLSEKYGYHASNLGGLLADTIAKSINIDAYIVDPVVTDELDDVARITGLPNLKRKSIFHALNQKSVAKIYAENIGKAYENINLIVAHLGGGVSVGAHCQGKVIDVNDALSGEGPFSPERSGTLPAGDLVKLCFSGQYSESEINKMIVGKGGFVAHLGTNKVKEIVQNAEHGDTKAQNLLSAFTYQVAKYIGMMSTVLKGQVDQIILTGGIAYNTPLMQKIIDRVNFITDVTIMPGEDEMAAMAKAAMDVLTNKVKILEY